MVQSADVYVSASYASSVQLGTSEHTMSDYPRAGEGTNSAGRFVTPGYFDSKRVCESVILIFDTTNVI